MPVLGDGVVLTARSGCAAGAARAARDAGFTLIELLVAVVILGVIMVPLGNAVIGYVRTTDATADRLALSHDAQLSAAYFARDVASTGLRDYAAAQDANGNQPFRASIQLDAGYTAGGTGCGTAGTPTALLRLLSDDWDTTGATPVVRTDVVAYYLAVAGTAAELHRLRCTGSATPVTDTVVAHDVVVGSATVGCSSTCTAAAVPRQVTLTFTVSRPGAGTYQIVLTGQRRQT